MDDLTLMLVISVILILIAGVATVMIGMSKRNKEENPEYMQKSKAKLIRLTILYVIATIAFVWLMVWLR